MRGSAWPLGLVLERLVVERLVVERLEDPDCQLGRAAPIDELEQAVEIPPTVAGELLGQIPAEPPLAQPIEPPPGDVRLAVRCTRFSPESSHAFFVSPRGRSLRATDSRSLHELAFAG
jgi:hypothetical protein